MYQHFAKIIFWRTVCQICIFLVLNDYLGNKPTFARSLIIRGHYSFLQKSRRYGGFHIGNIFWITSCYLCMLEGTQFLYCRPRRGPESGYRRQHWLPVLAIYSALDLNRPQQTFQTLFFSMGMLPSISNNSSIFFSTLILQFMTTIKDSEIEKHSSVHM